ncbi:hypothetical protein MUK42_14854 [Musa troglodytarum]|uniref:Uncharacterized protein n=1 Tax=Musa troglodytarum TaxID=320322 RepID=A0A9E7LAA8_9LILI|nr:hypothetical protein MUK42_14854 [Musa troglodytarum]URE43414.1 hypothetical protein MUK42_14854 [Musa troglodytarum]
MAMDEATVADEAYKGGSDLKWFDQSGPRQTAELTETGRMALGSFSVDEITSYHLGLQQKEYVKPSSKSCEDRGSWKDFLIKRWSSIACLCDDQGDQLQGKFCPVITVFILTLYQSQVMVNASSTLGDYHRILTPGESYEVTASMPGFQQKSTRILLGDESASLDFILDPDEASKNKHTSVKGFGCSCDGKDKLELVEYLRGVHLEIYILVCVSLFLCFLLRRKTLCKLLNRRQIIQKRAVVV